MNGLCEFEEVEGSCGQPVDNDGDDPRSELMCRKHCEFGFRVCASCGASAVRECGHEEPALTSACRQPMCNVCAYYPGHGHRSAMPEAEPAQNIEGQAAIDALRADLEKSIRDSLIHAGENSIPLDQTAAMVLQNLSMHITFQVLSGMAAHPPT